MDGGLGIDGCDMPLVWSRIVLLDSADCGRGMASAFMAASGLNESDEEAVVVPQC